MYRNQEQLRAGKRNESPSQEIRGQTAVLNVQREHEKLRRRAIEEAQSTFTAEKRRDIEVRAAQVKERASNVDDKARERLKKIERFEAFYQRQQDAMRGEPHIALLKNNARQQQASCENTWTELTHTNELLHRIDVLSLSSRLADAQTSFNTQADRLMRQTRLVEDAMKERKKLQRGMASIEAEVAEAEKAIALEELQMGGMQQEMDEVDAEIEQVNADIAKCEEQNSNLADQLSWLNAHVKKETAAVSAMEEQAIAKQTEIASLEKQLHEIGAEEARVKKETDVARAKLDTKHAACSEIKDELANVQLETVKVNGQLSVMHKELEGRALRRSFNEQQRKLIASAVQTAQAHVARLEKELACEKDELAHLQMETIRVSMELDEPEDARLTAVLQNLQR